MGEGEEAGAILRVSQALGIFYLSTGRSQGRRTKRVVGRVPVTIAWLLLCLLAAPDLRENEAMAKPRRQQGILTGMPFMANLAPRTFVDALGRKIYLANSPGRIVSLAPSLTETLYAIGAGDLVVGVTPFCDFPPEAALKPKVGYIRPNLESILALEPDFIVAPVEFVRADLLTRLEQLKIATFIVQAKTVEDIFAQIQTLGRILKLNGAADRVATDLRRRVADLRQQTDHLSRPRVLYVLNTDPLITVGPGSFIHHLIELAGGTNVAANAQAPYPRLSMEAVLKEDPELILFPVGEAEGIPEGEQQRWRRWESLSAVKHGRFHQIDANLLNRPGPRVVDGLEVLVRILHPDVLRSASSSQ